MSERTENEVQKQQISGPIENIRDMRVPEFRPEDNPHRLLEESSFATLFLKHREQYLRESWSLVEKLLATHFIKAEIDSNEGTMTVRTTGETWDPSIILKARDLMRLLAERVPLAQAQRVLEDDVACDIIKIGSPELSSEHFLKRRQRIIGPNDDTLKSIELLTKCYVFVQDQTVVAIGPYRGLNLVRRIVIDNMQNSVYDIKSLVSHLKDPKLINADWSEFLPKCTSKNISKHKKAKKKHVKKHMSLPIPESENKIDKQLANGGYFLKEQENHAKKRKERDEKQMEAHKAEHKKGQRPFISPQEPTVSVHSKGPETNDIKAIKKKVKKVQKIKS